MASDDLTEDEDDSTASFGVHKRIRTLPITAYFPVVPRRQTGLQVLRDTKITDSFPHLAFRRNGCNLSKSFLNLPAEIRVWIYEYALPLRRPYSEDLVTEDRPCSKGAHEACALEERVTRLGSVKHTCGYTALLVTCKTIYGEAVDVLYSPVRSHNQSNSTKMQLRISAKEITIRGHGMFCSTHTRYREGSDVLFSKMRYLSVHILAYRDEWWDSEDSYYEEVEEYHRNLDRVRDMAQCRGNIHWAVTQLRTATHLSTLALSMQWAEPLEYVRDPVFMDELEQFLDPLKSLRRIPEVSILTLGVNYEDFPGQLREFKSFKSRMIKLMSTQDPVQAPFIPYSTWTEFMGVLEHMRASCNSSRKREIEDILAHLALSFCYDEVVNFQIARQKAYSIWLQDTEKREISGEAILKVMNAKMPFPEEPQWAEGPEPLAEDLDDQLTSEEE